MWRMLFLGAAPTFVFGNPTLGPDGVLHASYQHDLHAINSNGSTKWIFQPPHVASADQSHVEGLNNTVYVTTTGQNSRYPEEPAMLVAIDSTDKSIKWKHQVGGMRELDHTGSPLVVAADGTIYLTSRDGLPPFCYNTTFEAFDPAGAMKWNFTVDSSGSLSAVGVDGPERGTVFIDNGTALYALWPHNGSVKWSVALDDFPHFTAFAEDGTVFLVHGNDTRRVLSSLNNEDGSVLWSYPFTPYGGPFSHSSEWWMIMNSRNELYVSGVASTETGDDTNDCRPWNCTCNIRVFDFDGKILRNFGCLSTASSTSYPQYEDEEDKFITTLHGNVLAHSGTDGHLLWNVSVSNRSLDDRAHFGRAGTVFVWSFGDNEDNHAYAIQDGKVAWSVQTGGASQQVMSEDGTTYIQGWTCAKGHPRCVFELEIVAVGVDGVEKWRYTPAQTAAMLV